jgi:hypothetical protein
MDMSNNEVESKLDAILAALQSLDRRVANLEGGAIPAASAALVAAPAASKPVSIKEFIISKAPSNGVLLTLTIGYYLENYDGISPLTAADLETGFRAAREAVPSNLNDKANNCVKKGYFMEAKEKKDSLKAWLVTRTGESIVEAGFG